MKIRTGLKSGYSRGAHSCGPNAAKGTPCSYYRDPYNYGTEYGRETGVCLPDGEGFNFKFERGKKSGMYCEVN